MEKRRKRPPTRRRPLILIVDDREDTLYLMHTVIDAAGMTVIEATDSAEALETARARRPDVIVSDILMPTMDGYELARRLREGPDAVTAPIVFYTATYHQPEAEALARRAGVAAVVYKDGEVAHLVAAIERALGPDQPAQAAIADSAAYSAEHARLVSDRLHAKSEQLANANMRLEALLGMMHVLGAESDPGRLLRAAAEGARQLAAAVSAGGVLFDAAGIATLRASAGAPLPPGALGGTTDDGPDLLLEVHSSGRPRAGRSGAAAGDDDVADTELLAAPIAINGQRFGTLFVAGSITREPFPPEALDLVASLTRYVAGFYGRALLLHEARRNASRLVLQHAIDAALLEGSSLQQLGERILPNLRELVGADVSALTRVHGDSGEVEILVNDPLPAGVGGVAAGSRHAVPPGTISALAVEGARIDITDVDILPQEEGPLALIRSVGLRSLLQEPMIVRGAVVGHLTLAAGRPDAFGPQDRELISDVAAQLAIALQQADLRAAVIKAEARYQELVERLPAVVYVDSLDGTAAHYVSPQVERMLGYEAADWLSDPARRLLAVHPEDRDRLEAELHAFRAYQQPTQVEYRFVTGNGREVWVRDEILPVEDLGTGQRLAQGIIFDITDAKRLEEQSRRGQKLEAVGLLAGAVAHDFNNLLTAIGGYSGLLLRDSSPFDPRRADLLAIQDATARATRLTRQLLAFGRRQPLEPVVLDLVASVETIGDLLRQLVGESIELRIRADPGPVSVLADASQLEQVVVNLVVNARDALAGHGTIELDVGFWHASPMEAAQRGHDPGAWAQLTVHDDGVGMDAQTQARIFEPFFSTKPLGEGTGLGLATVHGIVGQFGGSIDLQSAPGAGTTFRILLPIAVGAGDQGSVAAEGPPKVPLSSAGGTVLLVEDDAAVRIFAARALTAAGYQVIAAGSGDAALAAVIGDGPIVAVVTDAMMPGMSGAQLVARLRLDRPMVPVLFISGHTGELAGVPAGDRPLFKPFGPEELVAAVGTVIASAAAA